MHLPYTSQRWITSLEAINDLAFTLPPDNEEVRVVSKLLLERQGKRVRSTYLSYPPTSRKAKLITAHALFDISAAYFSCLFWLLISANPSVPFSSYSSSILVEACNGELLSSLELTVGLCVGSKLFSPVSRTEPWQIHQ